MSGGARERACAFAPASVGNVAIGFDILGFSVETLGDRVTVARRPEPGVAISAVRGIAGELPHEPRDNTAGRALLALQEAVRPGFGFVLEIDKGIPLGSGLGGSAASAVGAVVAANALLPQPCSRPELLKFARAGEAVARSRGPPLTAGPRDRPRAAGGPRTPRPRSPRVRPRAPAR